MTEVTIEVLEANFEKILTAVGHEPFVEWDNFTKLLHTSTKALSDMTNALSLLKEVQHKKFLLTMKKLKGLDLPDLISTVAAKKLPREALKTAISNFKLENGSLEFVEPADSIKGLAKKTFEEYSLRSVALTEQLNKFTEQINARIQDSGITIETAPEMKEIKATVKFNLNPEKIQEVAAKVQIQYLPHTVNLVGLKTYSQIVDGTFAVVRDEYVRLTEQTRVEQRKSTENHAKYLQIMVDYINNSEALIIEGQRLIAEKVGLTAKKFEDSQVTLMERGLANNILMIQSALRARIKECLPPRKDVSLDLAKEVISFQSKLIGEQTDLLKKIFAGLPKTQESTQLIPMILALVLNDLVFERYGYEEEDFMKNVGEKVIETNTELQALFKEMEIAIIRLMSKLEVIPEQVAKYMEEQANSRNQLNLPGAPAPGALGVMPGSNPMDLLQMQQMQQIQMLSSMKNSEL